MTVSELREALSTLGISTTQRMRKPQLESLLELNRPMIASPIDNELAYKVDSIIEQQDELDRKQSIVITTMSVMAVIILGGAAVLFAVLG